MTMGSSSYGIEMPLAMLARPESLTCTVYLSVVKTDYLIPSIHTWFSASSQNHIIISYHSIDYVLFCNVKIYI